MLSDERRYSRVPGIPFRRLEGEVVVVNPRRRQVHVLNGTAAKIWELLASARSLAQLVSELSGERRFDADPEEIARDVAAFVADLAANDLVTADRPSVEAGQP